MRCVCPKPLSGLVFAAFLAACGNGEAQTYRYGTFAAEPPAGWQPTVETGVGSTLVVFSPADADAAVGPALIWLELTQLADESPQALVAAVAKNLDLRAVAPAGRSAVAKQSFTAASDADLQATFYAFERDSNLYVWGVVGDRVQMAELGGDTLPLEVFNRGAPPTGPIGLRPAGTKESTVIATAGNFRLTQKMAEDTVAFAEFLAARTISAEDKRELYANIVSSFAETTPAEYKTFQDLAVLLDEIRPMPRHRQAKVRRDLLTRIWFDNAGSDQDEPLLDLIYRYNPILGADRKLGLVAPQSAFEALLNVNSFVGVAAGLAPLTRAERDALAKEVTANYANLNERQKHYLADGEINRLDLIRAWRGWDQQDRRKALAFVAADNVSTPEAAAQAARNLEHWAGIQLTSQATRQLIGFQADMMVLEHLRNSLFLDQR